jgi:NADH:ubiquinone reductase (non-electrogenic)
MERKRLAEQVEDETEPPLLAWPTQREWLDVLRTRLSDTIDDVGLIARRTFTSTAGSGSLLAVSGGPALVKKALVVVGSGWAAHALIKVIDNDLYDVTLISPRNHFLFTPVRRSKLFRNLRLMTRPPINAPRSPDAAKHQAGARCLPVRNTVRVSDTRAISYISVGTVEVRSAVEPIRVSNPAVRYVEASVETLDLGAQMVTCESTLELPSGQRSASFNLRYDVLALAHGEGPATFGVPGVAAHAFFLKEATDAIRRTPLPHSATSLRDSLSLWSASHTQCVAVSPSASSWPPFPAQAAKRASSCSTRSWLAADQQALNTLESSSSTSSAICGASTAPP